MRSAALNQNQNTIMEAEFEVLTSIARSVHSSDLLLVG
jgi:hypothetical protein